MCTIRVECPQAFFSDVTHCLRRKLPIVKSVQSACVLNTRYNIFNKRYICKMHRKFTFNYIKTETQKQWKRNIINMNTHHSSLDIFLFPRKQYLGIVRAWCRTRTYRGQACLSDEQQVFCWEGNVWCKLNVDLMSPLHYKTHKTAWQYS
jgi:hypothetical protein